MKTLLIATAAMAISGSVSAATVDFGTNFDTTDNISNSTAHGETVSVFDFGNGVSGKLFVTNGFGAFASVGEARIFDTTLSGTSDPDLEGPFTNVADASDVRPFGNALIIQERAGLADSIADDERRGGSIRFIFDNRIDLFAIDYLDGEEGFNVVSGGTTIAAVGSGISGDNLFGELTLSSLNIGLSEFTIDYNGSGAIGAFDIAVSAVPLPAGLPLLLAGLGGLAMVRRKKKASHA